MRPHLCPLAMALFIDVAWGDPPNRFHPVAWMGSLIALAQKRALPRKPSAELAYGAALLLSGSALSALLAKIALRLPAPLNVLLEAFLLKSTFSIKGLDQAAGEVQAALEKRNLPEARRLVSWHLVSRDVSTLATSQVAAAAIESVAENTSDGLVAPLFYYALGGLPLALAYRFVNTADSMLGYHDPAREWLGKAPARLDDLLNLLPARLSGLLIVLAAHFRHRSGAQAWQIMRRDAAATQSPNAGYPMSAMAGALDLELEKTGHYRLGAGGRLPRAADIQETRNLMKLAAAFALALSVMAITRRKKQSASCI